MVCHIFRFFFIMNSLVFVTFLLFRDDKTVKNKGHGLLGFYISNLSYTRTISTTRGSSILARLKCSEYQISTFYSRTFQPVDIISFVNHFNLCRTHKQAHAFLVPILRNALISTLKPHAVYLHLPKYDHIWETWNGWGIVVYFAIV